MIFQKLLRTPPTKVSTHCHAPPIMEEEAHFVISKDFILYYHPYVKTPRYIMCVILDKVE